MFSDCELPIKEMKLWALCLLSIPGLKVICFLLTARLTCSASASAVA